MNCRLRKESITYGRIDADNREVMVHLHSAIWFDDSNHWRRRGGGQDPYIELIQHKPAEAKLTKLYKTFSREMLKGGAVPRAASMMLPAIRFQFIETTRTRAHRDSRTKELPMFAELHTS